MNGTGGLIREERGWERRQEWRGRASGDDTQERTTNRQGRREQGDRKNWGPLVGHVPQYREFYEWEGAN